MTTSHAQNVAGEVRAIMARHRITQHQLAAHMNISQAAVSRRLTGLVPFDVDELATIAAWLGVPIASLLSPEVAA